MHTHTHITSHIHTPGAGGLTLAGQLFCPSHPPKSTKPAKTPSYLAPVAKHLHSLVDPYSHGHRDLIHYTQTPIADLNARHRKNWNMTFPSAAQAGPEKDLRRLTQRQIREALAGRRELHVRSAWATHQVLVRLDLDTHAGQTDLPQAVAAVHELLGGISAYGCPSRNGRTEIMVLAVPTYVCERTGEVRPAWPAKKVNARIAALGQAMGAILRRRGIATTIEALGGFVEVTQPREDMGDGVMLPVAPKRVVRLSSAAKLPTVSSPAEAEALLAVLNSPIPMDSPVLEGILALGRQMADETAALLATDPDATVDDDDADGDGGDDDVSPAPAAKAKKGRAPAVLTDRGTKVRNWWAAVALAARQSGARTRQELAGMRDRVVSAANTLYVAAGLGDANFDAKRHKKFEEAFEKVLKKFDPARGGGKPSGVWFDLEIDIPDVAARLSGVVPGEMLQAANRRLRAAGQPLLTYSKLAVIASTYGKNITVSQGVCPQKAVVEMLRHLHVAASWSTIAEATNILVAAGVMVAIDYARPATVKGAKGTCRRWHLLRPTLFRFLPGATAMAEQAAAARNGAGSRQSGRDDVIAAHGSHAAIILSGFSPQQYREVDQSDECESDVGEWIGDGVEEDFGAEIEEMWEIGAE